MHTNHGIYVTREPSCGLKDIQHGNVHLMISKQVQPILPIPAGAERWQTFKGRVACGEALCFENKLISEARVGRYVR